MIQSTPHFTVETARDFFNEMPHVLLASIRLLAPEHALAKLLAGKNYTPETVEDILNANGFTTERPVEVKHCMKEFYKGFDTAYKSVYGKIEASLESMYAMCIVAGVYAIYEYQMTDPEILERIEAAEKSRKSTAFWGNVALTVVLGAFTGGAGALAYGLAMRATASVAMSVGAGLIGSATGACLSAVAYTTFNRWNNETTQSIAELWKMFHASTNNKERLELLREIEKAANSMDGWLKLIHAVSDIALRKVKPSVEKKQPSSYSRKQPSKNSRKSKRNK